MVVTPKMQNKNDFTIDFFNLTRHFLFTHSDEIKAVAETISQQIIQNQQK